MLTVNIKKGTQTAPFLTQLPYALAYLSTLAETKLVKFTMPRGDVVFVIAWIGSDVPRIIGPTDTPLARDLSVV